MTELSPPPEFRQGDLVRVTDATGSGHPDALFIVSDVEERIDGTVSIATIPDPENV